MLMTIVVGLTCGLCLDRFGGQQMADSAAIVTLIVGLGAGTAYQVLDRADAVDRVLLCLTVLGAVILMPGGTAITGRLASAWVRWVRPAGFTSTERRAGKEGVGTCRSRWTRHT